MKEKNRVYIDNMKFHHSHGGKKHKAPMSHNVLTTIDIRKEYLMSLRIDNSNTVCESMINET